MDRDRRMTNGSMTDKTDRQKDNEKIVGRTDRTVEQAIAYRTDIKKVGQADRLTDRDSVAVIVMLPVSSSSSSFYCSLDGCQSVCRLIKIPFYVTYRHFHSTPSCQQPLPASDGRLHAMRCEHLQRGPAEVVQQLRITLWREEMKEQPCV